MSRFAIPSVDSATGATADIYAHVRKIAGGRVPNTYAALGYLAPDSLAAVLNTQRALSAGSLSQQDLQTIKLLVSVKAGCDVCIAAHSHVGKLAGLSADTLRAIRGAQTTGDTKRDALARFVSYLLTSSDTVSLDEFNAIRAAGYSDTQLAEMSIAIGVAAITSTFNRINGTKVDFPAVA